MAQQDFNYDLMERGMTGPRPIPGQSLTNSPETPLPFEGPTKFVETQPALDHIFLQLTEDEAMNNLETLLTDGYPVSLLAEQMLFAGFSEGLWNPDLMLLLLEPTIYMIMSIADTMEIENIVIEEGDEPELYTDEMSDSEKAEKLDNASKIFIKSKLMKNQMNDLSSFKKEPMMKEEPKVKPKSLLSREE